MKSAIFATAAAMLPWAFAAPAPLELPDLPVTLDSRTVDRRQVVQDLGPSLNDVLTVTGLNAESLLVQLSPDVADLLTGLGLVGLAEPVGSVIASASTAGELVADLGQPVEDLVVVIGQDGGALLVQLAPSVAALVSGLGLPTIGVPVGTIIATLGANLKRQTGSLVGDLGAPLNVILTVTGLNAETLLIQLAPSVAALLAGLGLPGLGVSVGSVIASAATVGELVADLGDPVEGLLTVISADGSVLLIQLAPSVAALLVGLGLPGVGIPVGTVIATLGLNL